MLANLGWRSHYLKSFQWNAAQEFYRTDLATRNDGETAELRLEAICNRDEKEEEPKE